MPKYKLGQSSVIRAALPLHSRRRSVIARVVGRPRLAAGQDALRAEESKLRSVWSGYRQEMLEVYLVSGYQDPRINAQSILARHLLIRTLFGSEFDELMREELAHAVELNEAVRVRAEELGVTISATLDPEGQAAVRRVTEVIEDRAAAFAGRWQDALRGREAARLSVIEFACGSANDFRSFADYGIARFLDYTGIDLNETNIANAKRMFPDVKFRTASILSLPEADRSVDFVIGFDILEHLSLPAMHEAFDAAVRICRRGIYFAFFRMNEIPGHENNPRGNYHINQLSAPMFREQAKKRFASVQLLHVPTMLADDYGYKHSYNPKAYSLIAERPRRS